jgi:hypothetical protein
MSDVGFEWPEWALAGLQGIEPGEVLQVLNADRRWPRTAVSDTGMQVLTVWGRTRTGRPLLVAVRQVSQWDWQILGARDLHPEEAEELTTWEEGQQ